MGGKTGNGHGADKGPPTITDGKERRTVSRPRQNDTDTTLKELAGRRANRWRERQPLPLLRPVYAEQVCLNRVFRCRPDICKAHTIHHVQALSPKPRLCRVRI